MRRLIRFRTPYAMPSLPVFVVGFTQASIPKLSRVADRTLDWATLFEPLNTAASVLPVFAPAEGETAFV